MCGCLGNMCTCITVFCIVCTVFFVLFRLCIFILICFVCTSVRNGKPSKDYRHRVTTQLQLAVVVVVVKNNNNKRNSA
jgi:hypothetical protein